MKTRTYTLEIFAPFYAGTRKPMQPERTVRVHCGTFESNRDTLSPGMIATKEVESHSMQSAKCRAREWFRAWQFARYTVTGSYTS